MKKKYSIQKNKGFTLLEMMVTISIFAVVSALVMSDYPKFNAQTSLTGLANQIAISVREAQINGVSVKTTGKTTPVYPAYGIFFGKGLSGAETLASSVAYTAFFDIPPTFGASVDTATQKTKGDERMTDATEILYTSTLGNGNTIQSIFCRQSASTDISASSAFIVFRRPNPDAKIKYTTTSSALSWSVAGLSNPNALTSCGEFHVRLASRDGSFRKDIVIYSSGQIAIVNVITP